MLIKTTLSSEELVKQKYPDAFVDDTGDWVYIKTMKLVKEACPECGQKWEHKVVDNFNTLGSGGSSENAWKRAAEKLGLV